MKCSSFYTALQIISHSVQLVTSVVLEEPYVLLIYFPGKSLIDSPGDRRQF